MVFKITIQSLTPLSLSCPGMISQIMIWRYSGNLYWQDHHWVKYYKFEKLVDRKHKPQKFDPKKEDKKILGIAENPKYPQLYFHYLYLSSFCIILLLNVLLCFIVIYINFNCMTFKVKKNKKYMISIR